MNNNGYMINLHRKYLINKFTIITSIIILFLVFNVTCFSIGIFKDASYVYIYRDLYYQKFNQCYLLIIKYIGVIFTVFIFGNAYTSVNDDLRSVIIFKRKQLISYFVQKNMVIIITSFLFISFISILMITLFNIKYPLTFDYRYFIKIALDAFIYSLILGTITLILVILFNNYFALMIPIILVLLREGVEDFLNSNIKEIVNSVFPILTNHGINIIQCLILIVLNLIIAFIIYYGGDMK